MVRRVAERLPTDERLVSCRADQTAGIERALSGLDARCVEDPEPDGGPMVGVHTGLRALDAKYAAVVAADMPFVDVTFLSHLFERATGHDAAVPRHEGWLQPTQAVYRTERMADACAAALSAGKRELRTVLSTLDCVVVEGDEIGTDIGSKTFTNVNTTEELAAAERALDTDDRSA
jgi:molybdopterin-guanine dinucleotide biosynthesis protein A